MVTRRFSNRFGRRIGSTNSNAHRLCLQLAKRRGDFGVRFAALDFQSAQDTPLERGPFQGAL